MRGTKMSNFTRQILKKKLTSVGNRNGEYFGPYLNVLRTIDSKNILWRSSQVEEIGAIIFTTQNGPEGI